MKKILIYFLINKTFDYICLDEINLKKLIMIIINFEVKQWHEAVVYGIAIRLSLMMLIQ